MSQRNYFSIAANPGKYAATKQSKEIKPVRR